MHNIENILCEKSVIAMHNACYEFSVQSSSLN